MGTTTINMDKFDIDSILNVYVDALMLPFRYNDITKYLSIDGNPFIDQTLRLKHQPMIIQYFSKSEDRNDKIETIINK